VTTADGLTAWVGEWCAARGLVLREAEPVRSMPWASVVCFDLDGDPRPPVLWGKAVSPAMATELDLLPVLARLAPDAVLPPLALDRGRGYLLLPDGGPTVGDVPPGIALAEWRSALTSYARLQHRLAPHAAEFLAVGVHDLRPDAAADAVAVLAARDDLHDVGGEHGLTDAEVRRLREVAVPGARAVARLLADPAVPVSIQHDDLSPSNALLDGRWLDWGDAGVAHPFASLLTLLDGTSGRPGGPSHLPALRALYLEVWAELTGVPPGRLNEEAEHAVLLAPVGRALAWLRAGPAALELYPGQVTRWLRRLADAPWPSAG
jgi:Phosphotransferase enzyme family